MTPVYAVVTVLCGCVLVSGQFSHDNYYGSRIGKFSTHFHDVKGDVYAVDERTIFIRNFSYDGKGVDTFFWAGTSVRPDASGFVVPDEKGSTGNLRAYDGEDIVIRLKQGNNVKDIRWLAVWSRRFRANFGSLIFPKVLQPPQPTSIGGLRNTDHGVSTGEIVILDTQTFLIEDFSYDGNGQDAFWWLSRGMKPNTGGLQLLDENHSGSPLRKYNRETVVVSVPEGHTIFEYDTLSIWSKSDVTDYGMVKIPKDTRVPPSAKSLGITPENKLNCEMLNDNLGFEARWVIEDDQLIMQLIANLDTNEYMALGFSKDDAETKFISADAVIAWISPDGQGHAVDYFLQSTDKCENGQGMCPDTTHEGADNNINLLNAAKVKDSITVTFRRSLKGVDELFDQNIYTDGPQAVLWAVGPVSAAGEPGPPKLRTRGNLLLDFGRQPLWNCPSLSEGTEVKRIDNPPVAAKPVSKIHCPTDLTFRAQLGPSKKVNGPKRVWYINGLPTPDLAIQKGRTYTFIVEGGNSPPNHHPLYITSSEDGGLYQKILEANEDGEAVYAGVTSDHITGALLPTSEGRLCEWTESSKNPEHAVLTSDSGSHPPLFLNCDSGTAGILSWTPDANTSDYVYYQSFTEKNLGGRIRVMDFCEETDPEHYLAENQRRKDFHPQQHEEMANRESELEREDEDLSDIIMASGTSVEDMHDTEPITEAEYEKLAPKKYPNEIMSGSEIVPVVEIPQISDLPTSESSKTEERILSNFEIAPTNEGGHTIPNNPSQHQGDEPLIKGNPDQGVSESVLTISSYPHDESERSDSNVLELSDSDHSKHGFQRQPPFGNFQRDNKPNNINRNVYEAEKKVSKPPPGFNVQLEGGFVPLVINSKEKESAVHSNYVPPPPHLRRPPRPFLFNESIPFHGTFKPGVPDFSGFNISHYTQDATGIDPNHLADHIALLSAPKPQIMQKAISPMNGFPPELFRRPHAGPRPQLLGYPPQPQMMHLPGHQQPLFFQLPTKPQPNFLIPPQKDDDDLDEVSSQRVQQISIQSPKEKNHLKDIVPGIPIRQSNNRNRQHGYIPPNLIPPSPPIQRRPDVVEDDEVNYQLQQRPQHSANIPKRNHPDNDKQQFRPPPPVTGRPQQFQRHPANNVNGFKNQRPPLAIPQRRPEPTGKHPGLFLQRPSMPRPMQQDNPIQDKPFVYRLPNRPTMHLIKQGPQNSGLPPPRYPPAQIHYGPIENGDTPSDKSSSEIQDGSVASHEISASQIDELASHEKQNANLHLFENRRPHPQLLYNRAPPQQPVGIAVQDTRPYINMGHPSTRPNEANVLNKEAVVRPPLIKQQHFEQQMPSEEVQDESEDEEQIDDREHQHSSDTSYLSEESSEPLNPEETVHQNNAHIISIEKQESQEIHLPPLHIQENAQVIVKPHNNINIFDPNHEHRNPIVHFKGKFEEKHEISTPLTPHAPHIQIHTNNPLINDHIRQPGSENRPTEHIAGDQESVPFGARLKSRPQEEGAPIKSVFQTAPQKPSFFPSRRQPQFSFPPTDAVRVITTTKRPAPLIKETPLYFNPSKDTPTKEFKVKEKTITPPKPAGTQEKLSLSTYPGRKNILPSDANNNVPSIGAPPRAPENIKLPEISEKPPSHDNGTDYSILSHVMSLIGGQPQPTNIVSPRNM